MSNTPQTPPAEPEPKPRRPRAAQDQAIANDITQIRTALTAAQNHADAKAMLTPRGYDDPAIAEGLAKCDAAQSGYNARQSADADEAQARDTLSAADAATRDGFDGFRTIARAVFKDDAAALQALGATGRVPTDREGFITFANAAYDTTLSRANYQSALSKRGYNPTALNTEKAKLSALTSANATHDAASAATTRATAQRDAAIQDLRKWWGEFRAVAQVAFKDRPDLASQFGL
ncbi:MAG: hypothetical protein HY257_08685 [Chloroflexi bacterium]|nr:hypothetical protein [Chloroflexota bacterium]